MPASVPDRFLDDAMRAGLVLGWLSVAAVLAALALGVQVEHSPLVLALTVAAAAAHAALGVVPWRRWLTIVAGAPCSTPGRSGCWGTSSC